MKKILCTLAAVGLAASVSAQGLVAFANTSASQVRSDGVAVPANGGFVQLLWAPQGSTFNFNPNVNPVTLTDWLAANTAWKLAGDPRAIGPAAGRFNAGGIELPTATPGAVVEVAVVGWMGNAASFDAAVTGNANVAAAGAFTVDTGNPNATPVPELAAPISGWTSPMVLAPAAVIPEPSSLALAGLGAAALLIFRRRK